MDELIGKTNFFETIKVVAEDIASVIESLLDTFKNGFEDKASPLHSTKFGSEDTPEGSLHHRIKAASENSADDSLAFTDIAADLRGLASDLRRKAGDVSRSLGRHTESLEMRRGRQEPNSL